MWVHAFLDSSDEMRKLRTEMEIALREEGETKDVAVDFIATVSKFIEKYSKPFHDYLI